jgi:hypothetical protein
VLLFNPFPNTVGCGGSRCPHSSSISRTIIDSILPRTPLLSGARGSLKITRLCYVAWNLHLIIVQFRIRFDCSKFFKDSLQFVFETFLGMLNNNIRSRTLRHIGLKVDLLFQCIMSIRVPVWISRLIREVGEHLPLIIVWTNAAL